MEFMNSLISARLRFKLICLESLELENLRYGALYRIYRKGSSTSHKLIYIYRGRDKDSYLFSLGKDFRYSSKDHKETWCVLPAFQEN